MKELESRLQAELDQAWAAACDATERYARLYGLDWPQRVIELMGKKGENLSHCAEDEKLRWVISNLVTIALSEVFHRLAIKKEQEDE